MINLILIINSNTTENSYPKMVSKHSWYAHNLNVLYIANCIVEYYLSKCLIWEANKLTLCTNNTHTLLYTIAHIKTHYHIKRTCTLKYTLDLSSQHTLSNIYDTFTNTFIYGYGLCIKVAIENVPEMYIYQVNWIYVD